MGMKLWVSGNHVAAYGKGIQALLVANCSQDNKTKITLQNSLADATSNLISCSSERAVSEGILGTLSRLVVQTQ